MEKSLLKLSARDVERRTLRPRADFIAEVVERVVRAGDIERPGYVVIVNPKAVLGTKPAVEQFQWQLMLGLHDHLRRYQPHAIRFQPYLDLPPAVAKSIYQRVSRQLIGWHVNGIISDKNFHIDIQQFVYVSFCPGQRRNIEGGYSRLLDGLALSRNLGLPDVRAFLELFPYDEAFIGAVFREEEICYRLRTQYQDMIAPCLIEFDDIDYTQYPILVFTNYLEDGILHGASPVRFKDATKPAVRPLQTVGLCYTDCQALYKPPKTTIRTLAGSLPDTSRLSRSRRRAAVAA